MKKLILLLALLFNADSLLAEKDEGTQLELTLPSAQSIVSHLRNHYGLVKATYLTQMAWGLSHSFASTEQLQQQWLQALTTEVFEYHQFNTINTHALMAQTLIAHTNGMTLNRWRLNDLKTPPQLPETKDGLSPDQVFQVWLNLSYFWQQILQSQPQLLATWLVWPDAELESKTPPTNSTDALPLVLRQLSNKNFDLIKATSKISPKIDYFDDLSIALLRQKHHFKYQHYLAYAYDWIEIYQLIELSPTLLTADEQKLFADLIKDAQQNWTTLTNNIDQIDLRIHTLLESIFKELPLKFKNPDHFNSSLNQQIFSLILHIKDPTSYMTHPIRQEVQENLEVCLNLSVSESPEPNLPIDNNQFESCVNEFHHWATVVSKEPSFAGNSLSIDNATSLHRALEVPSVQVINILTMKAVTEESCQQQLNTHANVFEWLMAAESMIWFHDRWPGMFAAYNKSAEIDAIIKTGESINQYPACLEQAQPLQQQFINLQSKWLRLKQEIYKHIDIYSKNELSPNNDINLFGSIEQESNHIPKDMLIKPCDIKQSCGAFIELKPNSDLIALFPNHLRLATQFGLGQLEICYDQVGWKNRQTVPTHLDNNKITNFSGQLSLQLNGMYNQTKVFTQELSSQQSHIYLFGENNQETLDMTCPLSIIGKQINTTLDRGTFGLLPNRLTFLTAQKIDINAVIKSNWDTWLANLKTDTNQRQLIDEMNGVKTKLNDAFLKHVNLLQQQVYRKLITSNPSRINDSALSKAIFDFLNQRRLLHYMVTGLFPSTYTSNENIRASLNGKNQLINASYFKQSFEKQVNVIDMINTADDLMSQPQEIWLNEPSVQTAFINKTLRKLKHINQIKSLKP